MFEDRREVFLHRVNVDFQCRAPLIEYIARDLQGPEFDYHPDIIFVILDMHENFPSFADDYSVNRDA